MPTRTRLAASGLVAVLVAALLGVSLVVAPAASASAGSFVSLINSERSARGLPGLESSGSLASVAAAWSRQMASSGDLAHNPSLTSQVSGWRFVGENVGHGPDAGAIHQAFMDSAAHRDNILDRDHPEELLQGRAVAALTGPGAAPATDPLGQALRFTAVMRHTHG